MEKVSVKIDMKRSGTFFIATVVDYYAYRAEVSEMTIVVRNEEQRRRWEKFLRSYTTPQDVVPPGQ